MFIQYTYVVCDKSVTCVIIKFRMQCIPLLKSSNICSSLSLKIVLNNLVIDTILLGFSMVVLSSEYPVTSFSIIHRLLLWILLYFV